MRKIICDTYEEASLAAAKIVASQITLKPESVLGFPTGSTPVGMYDNLSKMDLDFSKVTTFNLDEYLGLPKENDQSYWYFMNKNLYSRVNLKPENTNIPDGMADDIEKMCAAYDEKIASLGGLDLMVLGIGPNGHIGFNEPDSYLEAPTHVVTLTKETIDANSRFFENREDVPKKAVTMGVGSIMKAKKILIIITGAAKKEVAKGLLDGKVTTENPATMLHMHPDVTVVFDKEAL